jgi:adenylate cyclase
MTFLKITRYNTYFFFIGLLLNLPVLEGQSPVLTKVLADFPMNRKFSPDTRIYSQAYNADLDILAVSVKNRIILWNGYSIKEFLCKGNAFIEINKSGELYFASNTQFGVIEDIKKPNPVLHFLTELIPTDDLAEISGLACINEILFISTGGKVFKYDGKSISTAITTDKPFNSIKAINRNLYFNNSETGLNQVSFESFVVDTNFSSFFKGKNIEQIIERDQDKYVLTSQRDIYLCNYNHNPVKIIHIPDQFPGPYTAGAIDNYKLILGSKTQGILIIDLKSKELSFLSKMNGLLDNSIKEIFTNPAGFFLCVHPGGISRVLNPSAYSSIEYSSITDCRIDKIFKTKIGLFLGTTKGIFQFQKTKSLFPNGYYTSNETLAKVSGYDGEVKSVFKSGDQLYFISENGILILRNNALSLFQSIQNVRCAFQSTHDSSLLILGLTKGWQILKFEHKGFRILYENLSFPLTVEAISETGKGYIMLKTSNNNFKEASQEIFNKTKTEFNFSEIKSPVSNSETQMCYNGKNLIINTLDSLFIFDEINKSFKKLDYPKNLLGETLDMESISQDNYGNIWFTGRSKLNHLILGIFLLEADGKGSRLLRSIGLENSEAGPINDLILTDEGGILYVTNDKLINIKDSISPMSKIHITIELANKTDKLIIDGNKLFDGEKRIHLSHRNNVLTAMFFSDFPDAERSVVYRYKLSGAKPEFSSWSAAQQINFNELSSGSYVLTVEARSLNGSAFARLEFPFHINIPIFLKWFMILIYVLLVFSGIIIYVRWKSYIFLKDKIRLEAIVSQRTEELQNEKEKSEQLLANILPKDTADELKKKGKATTQKYEMVTVLFSDIQGFTKIAEQMNPEALIDQLDNFYFHFDSVVEKYNIEKIKTIGDAYMCAGGIPEKNRTNPVEVVLAALEVQDFMKELKKKNSDIWDVRIGIHTGPVIAGVIGHKKFSYDIWGDTVNTASRMESSGEASKINISGHTYELVKDFFICEYRGKMPVKYKGEIDMYFVKGIRPELSVDLYRVPNKNFFIHMQKLRLVDIEEFIIQTFETNVTPKLHFHNQRHTMEVYSLVELLGRAEGVTEEELLMARTAALMGDTGFLTDYNNNIAKSIEFARQNLARFKYSENQIQQVVQLLQTKDKVTMRSSQIEKIMADAETIYFGRVDFLLLAENQFKELHEMQIMSSKETYITGMTKTLQEHQFFTETAKRLQEISITEQIDQLIKLA